MQEADRDRLETFVRKAVRRRRQRGLVERLEFLAARADAAAHGKAMLARNQRRGQTDAEIVLVEAVLGAHLDDVSKTLRRHEGDARAAPFDQRVGGQRRAVDDAIEVGGTHAGLSATVARPSRIACSGARMGRQRLGRVQPTGDVEHDVGESAADIGAKTDR